MWAFLAAVRTLPFSLCETGEGFEQTRDGIRQDGVGWDGMDGVGYGMGKDGMG